MPERSGGLDHLPEAEFADAVERIERELRDLHLPEELADVPRGRGRFRLGLVAGALVLAGAFTASVHIPTF